MVKYVFRTATLVFSRGVRHAVNNSIICTNFSVYRRHDLKAKRQFGPQTLMNTLCLNFLQMLSPTLLLSNMIYKCVDLKFLFQMLTALLCWFGILSNGSVVDALKFSALLCFLFCSADLDMAATFP